MDISFELIKTSMGNRTAGVGLSDLDRDRIVMPAGFAPFTRADFPHISYADVLMQNTLMWMRRISDFDTFTKYMRK